MIDITDKLDLIKDKIKDFFLKKNLCQDNKKTSHRVGESWTLNHVQLFVTPWTR